MGKEKEEKDDSELREAASMALNLRLEQSSSVFPQPHMVGPLVQNKDGQQTADPHNGCPHGCAAAGEMSKRKCWSTQPHPSLEQSLSIDLSKLPCSTIGLVANTQALTSFSCFRWHTATPISYKHETSLHQGEEQLLPAASRVPTVTVMGKI